MTVIDTLSSDWNSSTIVAGNGTNGEVPNIFGNTITWNISNPIAITGTWSATLSARLNDVAGTGTNGVIAVGKCSNGCIYSSATDSARTINIGL